MTCRIESSPPVRAGRGGSEIASAGALLRIAPTLGALVAHAAAVGRVEGATAGLAALDAIGDDAMRRFQPAWAMRAHLLAEAERGAEAVEAFRRAISLTTDPGMRSYLEQQRCSRIP